MTTTKEALEALSKGGKLCMEHGTDGNMVFWLEPSRRIVRRDIAESIIKTAGLKSQHDGLFETEMPQTWTL